jgi:DNA replication protein DnaC
MSKPKVIGKKCGHCLVELIYHDEAQMIDCFEKLKHDDQNEEIVYALRQTGSVSSQFGEQTWANADPEIMAGPNMEAWEDAKKWAFGDYVSAYMWGPPGTGKTYAARCLLYESMDQRNSVTEITAYNMLKNERGFSTQYKCALLEGCTTLLIDDIDKAIWDDRALMYLLNLLDTRSTAGGKTLITSNVAPGYNLRTVLSGSSSSTNGSIIEAAMQRLHPTLTINFAGESIRLAK